jgi:hypothetical protein
MFLFVVLIGFTAVNDFVRNAVPYAYLIDDVQQSFVQVILLAPPSPLFSFNSLYRYFLAYVRSDS